MSDWQPIETAPRTGCNILALYLHRTAAMPEYKVSSMEYLRYGLAVWYTPGRLGIDTLSEPDPQHGHWINARGERLEPLMWLEVPDPPQELLAAHSNLMPGLAAAEQREVTATGGELGPGTNQ